MFVSLFFCCLFKVLKRKNLRSKDADIASLTRKTTFSPSHYPPNETASLTHTTFSPTQFWLNKDTGSQYCCGWVGRGIQPPSTSQPTCNTQTYTKSVENACFPTFQLDHHDQRTDGRTNGRTKPLIELRVRN